MSQIKDFAQVRADGNIAPSSLTVKEMIALGWGPSKVVALQWKNINGTIEIKTPGGAHGIVVPGANFVAALYDADENNPHGRLVIIAADGSERSELSNHISILGKEFHGSYSWFEPALTPSSDCFGVVFETDEEIAFRCDVDANESRITDAVRSR